jgi:hypothetical protein
MVKEECVFFLLAVYLGYLQHCFYATNEPPSKESTFRQIVLDENEESKEAAGKFISSYSLDDRKN